ncbi:MAG: 23S rRNA (adenine(2503)-C(2))-methyltransferase RlmN, partial [Lachnospiraceae bacterium]|nr:23S rRNA (adenine(2503)-C(2))-methyltransferase RlmN [Lachnospiraceae bacterium]
MTDICSLNIEELKSFMAEIGEKPFRATQVFEWIHVKKVNSFDEMTNLSKALREKLSESAEFLFPEVELKQTSKIDGTRKYLFKLKDGNMIESVLMSYHHGYSICISSQVGCRMGCTFCASGIGGLIRNLTPSEMLGQVYGAAKEAGVNIDSIVIMGTGEPLDNFDNLVKFLELITDEKGNNLSRRSVTISTCGLVPKIKELADLNPGATLALSLHAATQEKREKIMPIAKSYEIHEVLDAFDYYFKKTGRRGTIEYSLVAGVNDADEDAENLHKLLKGKNCHVNLIPVNPVEELGFKNPTKQACLAFQKKLENCGINVTIRRELG